MNFNGIFSLSNDKVDLVLALLAIWFGRSSMNWGSALLLWFNQSLDWTSTIDGWLLGYDLVIEYFEISWFNRRYRFCEIRLRKRTPLRLFDLICSFVLLAVYACQWNPVLLYALKTRLRLNLNKSAIRAYNFMLRWLRWLLRYLARQFSHLLQMKWRQLWRQITLTHVWLWVYSPIKKRFILEIIRLSSRLWHSKWKISCWLEYWNCRHLEVSRPFTVLINFFLRNLFLLRLRNAFLVKIRVFDLWFLEHTLNKGWEALALAHWIELHLKTAINRVILSHR